MVNSGASNLDSDLRERISHAVSQALQPFPDVLAGWEGGSVAFDVSDEYSDIDLMFLATDTAAVESLYAAAEASIRAISEIACTHSEPPGRYYKLQDGGELLLLDLCFVRMGAIDHCLDIERHGKVKPLFDKGSWIEGKHLDCEAMDTARSKRLKELLSWFRVSQSFVHKAILRGQHAEALCAYWGYTLRPLTEILRMRYCPARWDFGMRYLARDLPADAYGELQDLMFVSDPEALGAYLEKASLWGEAMLSELESGREPSARVT